MMKEALGMKSNDSCTFFCFSDKCSLFVKHDSLSFTASVLVCPSETKVQSHSVYDVSLSLLSTHSITNGSLFLKEKERERENYYQHERNADISVEFFCLTCTLGMIYCFWPLDEEVTQELNQMASLLEECHVFVVESSHVLCLLRNAVSSEQQT